MHRRHLHHRPRGHEPYHAVDACVHDEAGESGYAESRHHLALKEPAVSTSVTPHTSVDAIM